MVLPPVVQQWTVACIILLMVAGLIRERWRPSALFFFALLTLTLLGIISPEDMMSGFSNTQIATVILLLVIGNVINQTTIVPSLFDRLFKYAKSYKSFLGQMMLTVSTASAFTNNTPLVAMLIPYVYNWGKKNRIAPSKLLIPLSFATIAGGMITLIGTSTNLIINGLMTEDGLRAFNMFEFAPIGIPVTLLVFLYMLIVGSKVLPDNRDPVQVVKEESKPFLVEIEIGKNSPISGKTLEEVSGLFFRGLFVVAAVDNGEAVSPVDPYHQLHGGDRLIVKGSTESISALLSGEADVHLPQEKRYDVGAGLDLIEIVVSYNSSLANKKVSETKFRSIYGGSILAIHREEGNILNGVGEEIIHPGDVLMVLADMDALRKFKETADFYVITKESTERRIGGKKAWAAGAAFALLIVLNTAGFGNLFVLSLLLAGFFYFLKVTNFRSIQRSLDIDLILVLALSIGLGKAIKNTGLAASVAEAMNDWFGQFGVVGALVGIYLLANILTQLISNAASATIVFPIAVATAQVFQADAGAFVMTVAFAASLDFSTPIGYQTNLMVYGPGGYKFTDYMKVGIPLNLGLLVLVVAMICWLYRLV